MARILIADDDLFYRQLVSGWIADINHDFTAVADGITALLEWEQATPPYDCLILDVYMAGHSGLEILHYIRERNAIVDDRNRRAPIIIMTSDESAATELTARQHKAFSFLIKPFGEKELKQTVKNALNNAKRPHTTAKKQ